MAEQSISHKKDSNLHVKVDCPSQITDLYDEIEKVKKQIDELLINSDPNDPQVKNNVKKMKQIKKFLTKKTAQGGSSFLSLKRKKKQDIKNAINSILQDNADNDNHEILSVTSSELIETFEDIREKPKIVCLDIDDTFVHAADCIISFWNKITYSMNKVENS
ncbi:hypothetical protein PVAND_000975 [Polypedilum vanderplanki]|uniref:Uncharacterized protein n=1 Tax=Polypedilum vanderplanki TaxID=319348 RepID=A0A9J6BMR1_POLVA|nr:hypothetical protein PVAND_000975 [Polypedilum vanderplanki]